MSVQRGYPNGGNFYSNIVKPIKIDCNFVVDSTNGNGLGIRSLKSNGYVRNVFMNTSATPGSNDGMLNPNPAAGIAMIQLKNNYNTYLGGFSGFVSPVAGSNISISGSSVLTKGNPYVITAVGAVPKNAFTIAPVADSSGSLAGKYFTFSDGFSNNYVVWFSVSGVGSAPSLIGPLNGYQAVQQSISTGASAATIGAALVVTIGALNGSNSFTASGTTTVTVTSKLSNQLSPRPADVNTGFSIAMTVTKTLVADWQSVGLLPGFTPTVGQSFIATATGSAVGTGTVKAAGVSGITSIEVIGDSNASVNNSSIASNGGAILIVQFLAPTVSTGAYVSPMVPTAPAAGSAVGMTFFFDGSAVTVDGL